MRVFVHYYAKERFPNTVASEFRRTEFETRKFKKFKHYER